MFISKIGSELKVAIYPINSINFHKTNNNYHRVMVNNIAHMNLMRVPVIHEYALIFSIPYIKIVLHTIFTTTSLGSSNLWRLCFGGHRFECK